VTMLQAIKSVFSKYVTLGGRAGGTEFWWFILFQAIVVGIAELTDRALFGHEALFSLLCSLALLLPGLAVSVRRLHDTNHSGWWLLLGVIPIAGLILVLWICTPSTSGPNRFGPMPRAISDEGVAVW
jgi:uncharacterized membrane protein YhaH (DUF805 family)